MEKGVKGEQLIKIKFLAINSVYQIEREIDFQLLNSSEHKFINCSFPTSIQ